MKDAPVRIAMLTNLYPPLGTGSAVQSSGLARELARQGHEVVVFTARVVPDTPLHEVTADGVHIHRLPCLTLPKLPISMNFPWLNATICPTNLRFMSQVIAERRIQVMHIHNHMFDMALNGMWLSRKLDIPTLVTLHTVILHTKALYNAILCPTDRYFLGSLVVRRATGIICPDCTVEKYLSGRFKRSDGHIIPYGIQLPEPPTDTEVAELRARWNLVGKRVILSLGHMHALRNRMELVKAFADVIPKHPDARLVIVGSRGHPPTEELVKSLNLEEYVIFTGPQPHTLVPAFHKMAECEPIWLDQQNMASAGVACLEAMYYGKAVITACPEDTHEEGGLVNGKNVIILPRPTRAEHASDAILRLLGNPDQCRNIGENAAKFVRSYFAWDNVVERHVRLYRDVALEKAASTEAVCQYL